MFGVLYGISSSTLEMSSTSTSATKISTREEIFRTAHVVTEVAYPEAYFHTPRLFVVSSLVLSYVKWIVQYYSEMQFRA